MFYVLIALIGLASYAYWLSIKAGANKEEGASFRNEQSKADELTVQALELLVQQANESLEIASKSHEPGTKLSRLELAKQRVSDIEDILEGAPWAKVEGIPAMKADIHRLAVEFAIADYRAMADGNGRGQELEKEGRIQEAIEVYESLLQSGADTPFTYRRLAILYRKAKDRENELRAIKAGISNVPASNHHREWFIDRLTKMSE